MAYIRKAADKFVNDIILRDTTREIRIEQAMLSIDIALASVRVPADFFTSFFLRFPYIFVGICN